MRLIDADALTEAMYKEAFEKDSDMQKWDSGCWIRYKLFENVIESVPTIASESKWHELRKNPDDLPKADGSYLCALRVSKYVLFFVFRFIASGRDYLGKKIKNGFYDHDPECGHVYIDDVVAWMEIPEFKEDE